MIIALALFGFLRLLLPALGTLPRTLTAEEADTLLGAQLLCERVAVPAGPDRPPFKDRLKAGFETTASNPRLASLASDRTAQRAAVEAPLPRWLGALGIGVLPTSAGATNLERAATASALAVALALTLLVWGHGQPFGPSAGGLRRHGLLVGCVAAAALLATPGVVDAALSAGHGASAVLVSVLFLTTLERVLSRRAGVLGMLALGGLVGLALGIHPMALVLYLVVLSAWAIRVAPAPEARAVAHGGLRLPSVPLLLLLLPVVALVVLVVLWPALWNETGKRLGAWLLDAGSAQSPPHEVLGVVYDQASGRSAQAFTALLQWVAWTPSPLLALWLVGLARAIRLGREGAWAPIVTLLMWLAVGALDGGLFGGRNSLLALMWVPTAITAAHGAAAALNLLEARLAQVGARPAARPLAWLAGLPVRLRTALVLTALLIAPVLQSARGTTFGMARQTGAELRAPLPLALINDLARAHPWAVLAAGPRSAELAPGLEAVREGLSLDLRTGTLAEADVLLLTTSSAAPVDPRAAVSAVGPVPSAEVLGRLGGARELARDPRPGLIVSLWELTAPGPLDKRPALPHN